VLVQIVMIHICNDKKVVSDNGVFVRRFTGEEISAADKKLE
jgi:hypothetical protein